MRAVAKVSNPPELNDGRDHRFGDWMRLIKNKLLVNTNHFYTPTLRIAYVVCRCTGDAVKHVSPRMRDEAISKYADSDDIFEPLDGVFGDLNPLVNAKRRFHSLMMKPSHKLLSFPLSKFL